VIARYGSLAAVHAALEGWEEAQYQEASLDWLYDRLDPED
jgi:hypothetical protein